MTRDEQKKTLGALYLSLDLLLEHLTDIRREVRLLEQASAPHNSVNGSRYEYISSKFDLIDVQHRAHLSQLAALAEGLG